MFYPRAGHASRLWRILRNTSDESSGIRGLTDEGFCGSLKVGKGVEDTCMSRCSTVWSRSIFEVRAFSKGKHMDSRELQRFLFAGDGKCHGVLYCRRGMRQER